MNPKIILKQVSDDALRSINVIKGREKVYLLIQIISFIAVATSVIMAFKGLQLWWLYGGIALIVYILFTCMSHRLSIRRRENERLLKTTKHEYKALDGDYTPFDAGRRYSSNTHNYSADLDIFGSASLYQRVCRCVTRIGANRLAQLLQYPPEQPQEVSHRRAAIEELSRSPHKLILFIAKPYCNIYARTLQIAPTSHPVLIFSVVLMVLCIGALICGVIFSIADLQRSGMVWGIFSILAIVQLILSTIPRAKLMRYYNDTKDLSKSLGHLNTLTGNMADNKYRSPMLKDIVAKLDSAHSSMRRLLTLAEFVEMTQSNIFMYLFVNGLGCYNLLLCHSYTQWSRENTSKLKEWFDAMAEYDALVSEALYAAMHPEHIFANMLPDNTSEIITAAGMYHPFISKDIAVGNDFTMTSHDIALITGANMSGKSTFLRSVGLNLIMARCGLPVAAQRFDFRPRPLITCMRTVDNVVEGRSYFHAELLRLKKMLTEIDEAPDTLFIVDEMLKGTNSTDKLNGSRQLLLCLSRMHATGLVATHDLELSELSLTNRNFKNYCFEISIQSDDETLPQCPYKMSPGVARNLNATLLINKIINEVETADKK